MTLNSTIITAAYRESNFTSQGGTLTTEEQTEGLALLQSLVDSFHGIVVGTRLKPWYNPYPFNSSPDVRNYPASAGQYATLSEKDLAYPPANSRVFLRTTTAKTIYFQYAPEDGALMQIIDAGFTGAITLDANGMFFGTSGVDRSVTLNPAVGGGSRVPKRTYMFRGDLAAWVQLDNLVYTGENPFPAEFDDFWITLLAMRLAPRFGNEPVSVTMLRNKEMLVFARGWYRQTAEAIVGDAGTPTDQSWNNRGVFGDPDSGVV